MPRTKRIAYLMFFNKRIPRKCGNIWKLRTGILRYKYRVIKKVEFQTDKDKTVRKNLWGVIAQAKYLKYRKLQKNHLLQKSTKHHT